ncbi:hypothetical protein [Thermococcus nautili]|uniref:Uncharacterized protein n=1 Tax=Thermococcus nautili TaxID=195522 RepID=W8P4B2_9EURY|nr:hypothetical protein [Thermococcus nautili]AHL22270.1 hypothetical protein BD01_0647 [Thermococcus nautili]CAI1493681.1 conserved protein of unknown function [Thermococcus nautili]
MDVKTYNLPPDFARKAIEDIERYGIVAVDVENRVSLLDDMLKSDEEKLKYAREKVKEGNVDKAVLVVRDGIGTLVINVENVVEIRVELGEYEKLLREAGVVE